MARPVVFIAGKDPSVAAGGHADYVRAHARAATRAGFEPQIFCPSGTDARVLTDYGVVHRVRTAIPGLGGGDPHAAYHKAFASLHAWRFAPRIERYLAGRAGPHLIQGFDVWGYAGLVAARRLARNGVATRTVNSVYTLVEHEYCWKVRGLTPAHAVRDRLLNRLGYLWIRWVIERLEGEAYRCSDLVTLNYQAVWDGYRARYGERDAVRRISYTSDSAFRDADTRRPCDPPAEIARLEPRDAPLLVCVARQDPRKGIHVLIEALARLRTAGVPFRACLVGGGPLLEAHRRLARRAGLGETTVLAGRVADPFPYLCHADLFVLPSLQEGSGSVALIEAAQAGLPIVASGIDGIPEDVTHEVEGLLVGRGDAGQLASALARLLGDGTLRRRLAEGARRLFEQRFSAEAFTSRLRAVYAELGVRPNPSEAKP